MKVVVFGATGGTGRETVEQAVGAGHRVTAVVRRRSVFEDAERLRVVLADFDQPEQMDAAVRGQEVVISALGSNAKGPVSVCTDGVRSILAAMGRTGVRRLVVVSAHGAAESRDRSPYSLVVWASVGNKMRDKESMEALVKASDVEWTIVRPPMLTGGPAIGRYRTGIDLKIRLTSKISRADLGGFLLTEAAAPTFLRQAPRIAA